MSEVELGRSSERQVYLAAVAAIPDQKSRSSHLLKEDIRGALRALPDIDTSDDAIQRVVDQLVHRGHIEVAGDKYKIVDRTPKAETAPNDDSELNDLFSEMGGDAPPVQPDTSTSDPAPTVEPAASTEAADDQTVDDLFVEMRGDGAASDASPVAAPAGVGTAPSTPRTPDSTPAAATPDTGGGTPLAAVDAAPDAARAAATPDTSADTPPAAADAPPAPPAAPPIPRVAKLGERRFARWANQVQAVHQELLRIVSDLKEGALDDLKAQFQELTGEAWTENFEMHQFLADKKDQRIANRESETTEKERQYTSSVDAYKNKLIELFSELGVPDQLGNDIELDELTTHIRTSGAEPAVAIGEFVDDVRDDLIAEHGDDFVQAQRALYLLLARMVDRTLQYHMRREHGAEPTEEPAALKQAREKFLQAQEAYNDFERKIFRNPFTSKKRRQELSDALEAARTEYNQESARVIAGRSHRFLNEYNAQIDREIAIRDERQRERGVVSRGLEDIKNGFYGIYKWMGDQSLDKAYQSAKGEEPTKGRWIRKAFNLRTAIGYGLGLAGLRTGWRVLMGTGMAIGTYEGLKARKTAEIQAAAHAILAAPDAATMDEGAIYQVLQEIRTRAALDGKTVVDTNFPLHRSFVQLRELLSTRQEAVPQETREQAFQNRDIIDAKLREINAQLESSMTEQADQRRRQVAGAVATGVVVGAATPYILKYMGIAAEHVADWWGGDPADAADVPALVDTTPDVPEAVTPPVPEVGPLPGEGITAEVSRGQGAYHAVYKLMDQLSPAEQQTFAEAIAKEHPEWVERGAQGQIENLDRVLRNWRMEAVGDVQLDNGESLMIYNAATREYGAMLHPGAEFQLEYDADGYPQLHLLGTEDAGHYRIYDDHVVRVQSPATGARLTVEADAVAPAPEAEAVLPEGGDGIDASDVDADATVSADMESGIDHPSPPVVDIDAQRVLGTGEPIVGNLGTATDAPVARVPMPEVEGSRVAAAAVVEPTPPRDMIPMRDLDATHDVVPRRGVDIAPIAEPEPDIAPAPVAPEIHPMRLELGQGRSLEFSYDAEGGITTFEAEARFITRSMFAEPLLNNEQALSTLDWAARSSAELELRTMYVFDEAMDTLRDQGLAGSDEYALLERMYRRSMEQVANTLGTPVGETFDVDVLREYGYSVPDAPVAAEAPDVTPEEVPAAAAVTAEAVNVPDVGGTAPEISSDVLQGIREVYNDLSRINQRVVLGMQQEYEQGIADWDDMNETERTAFLGRIEAITKEFEHQVASQSGNS